MTQRKRRILVVDDEADTAQTLRIMLEKYEFATDVFTDPKIALGAFKPNYYDVVILDIRMPAINGFELYSKMNSTDSKIKVLFLTALADLNNYSNFKDIVSPVLGKRHFVRKPVSESELLDQVYSIL